MIARAALAMGTAMVLATLPSLARAERIVDHGIDQSTAERHAAEQGVALVPLPARGTAQLALRIAPEVDHEVVRGGIACSAWKVRNPLSVLLQRFLTAADGDGMLAPSPAGLLVTVERAGTFSRCVGTGELKTTCITRVWIAGTTTRSGGAAEAFRIDHEDDAKGVGVCAGLTRGIGLVSRAAAAALVGKVQRRAPSPL